MKKSLIAMAVLGAMSSAAFAQSNVTIYGIVDAGIVSERGGVANTTKVTSGVGSASRLGFKGTEDLGGGLSAIFVLESGVKVDTGASDVAGSIANRQSYVGLKSTTAGQLTLGRQYTPYYETLRDVADPFALGYAGTAKNLFGVAGIPNNNDHSNTRNSNAIVYLSPVVEGFQGEVSYSVGEQAGDASAQRQLGTWIGYSNGPLNVRVAYNATNNDVAGPTKLSTDIGRNTMIAGNYDFGVVKAFAAYSKDKGTNSSPLANNSNPFGYAIAPTATRDSNVALIGATAPIGPNGTLMASYTRKNDKEVANHDADQWAVGYSYALSKRTSTYVAFAKIKNKNGASYTVGNNTEAGSGDKAFNLGMRHSF
ncbi:porin [Duganella vulcania]|uniref:Porin n=1 Tax=Duganella vulcania TaxID=2692166 RepID=A0A845GFH3_9BURK|nr:porin [Duganella vulcania]MYM93353.1 porin [Duganella vulcania]